MCQYLTRLVWDNLSDDLLLAAYRRTRFCADTEQGQVVIRVGEDCPALDALLRAMGCATYAYITAFNPGSIRLTDEENYARQSELNNIVRQLAHPAFPGEGIGDDGVWPPEQSILVLGIEYAAAVKLGRQFGQRAIVFGTLGRAAGLAPCQ